MKAPKKEVSCPHTTLLSISSALHHPPCHLGDNMKKKKKNTILQHIPVESDREEVRDWVLSVCMDATIDQALPPEKEASGTLYQVHQYP